MQISNRRGYTITTTIPILLLIASLFLLLGVLAITAIMLVASKCKCKALMKETEIKNTAPILDAWVESGKRLKHDFSEQ